MKLTFRTFFVTSLAVVFCGGSAAYAQSLTLELLTDSEPVLGYSESAPIQVRLSGPDRPIPDADVSFTPMSGTADTYLSVLRDSTNSDGLAGSTIMAGVEAIDFDVRISAPNYDVIPLTVHVRVASSAGLPEADYPGDFSSIQEAIDALADGGTLRIAPGFFNERLVIAGKDVNIVGSGSGIGWRNFWKRTVLVAPRPERLVPLEDSQASIEFRSGGGGSVKNMAIRGGDIGIELNGATEVIIENTRIANVGYGVVGQATGVTVVDSVISNSLANALLMIDVEAMNLLNNFIFNTDQVGILVFNLEPGGGSINIFDQTLWFSGQGGIVVLGGEKPVYISNCQINFSGLAGILLIDTGFVAVLDTNVFAVTEIVTPGYGGIADGLIAVQANQVHIDNSNFEYADRVGTHFIESGGMITNTTTYAMRFGLVIYESPNLDWADPNNDFDGEEKDIEILGTTLPVPEAPPVP